MPVGKGSIVRATNASNHNNLSIVTTAKKMPEVLTRILVEQIVSVPESWRTGILAEEKVAELMKSIQTYGIIEPVILRRIGESQFQILSGDRRLQAAKKLGFESISSCVIDELKEEEAMEIYHELHKNNNKDKLSIHEAKFEAVSKITKDMPVYLL